MQNSLFNDLKIIDLSTVLAGPSVATFFAELGAEVLKIENPMTSGDITRSWKLQSEDQDTSVSAYFSAVNYGKKYLSLNISETQDKKLLLQHIEQCDILIVNFKEGDEEKFELTPEILFTTNPRLIFARITGFENQTERATYDVVLQAETGFMDMNGTSESGPIKMPVAMIDIIAAHQLKEGILCALLRRNKDNIGRVVSCSLEKAGIGALMNQATNYLMVSHIAQRIGSLHPNIAPYGEIFYCADKKALVLAVGSDNQFNKLLNTLGLQIFVNDPRFSTNQNRVVNRTDLYSILSEVLEQQNRDHWMNEFNDAKIPAGAIKNIEEVMNGEIAKGMLLEEKISGIETKRLSSVSFTIQ